MSKINRPVLSLARLCRKMKGREANTAVVVGTVTNDLRIFEVPKLKVSKRCPIWVVIRVSKSFWVSEGDNWLHINVSQYTIISLSYFIACCITHHRKGQRKNFESWRRDSYLWPVSTSSTYREKYCFVARKKESTYSKPTFWSPRKTWLSCKTFCACKGAQVRTSAWPQRIQRIQKITNLRIFAIYLCWNVKC